MALRLLAAAIIPVTLLVCAENGAVPAHRQDTGRARVEAADPVSPQALGWTADQLLAARRYSRGRWALLLAQALGGIALLAAMTRLGIAGRLQRRLSRRLPEGWRMDLVVAAAVLAALGAARFPLLAARRWREQAYGFSTQRTSAWLADQALSHALEMALGLAVVVALWALIRRMPRWWWAAASGAGAALAVLLAAVLPVLVAPLFNTFRPLPEGDVRDRVLALARAGGAPGAEVYTVDASRRTAHDNAYVTGLLGTERIVLYDTLLSGYTPGEVEFVVGHELGHHVERHVAVGVAAGSLALAFGLWLLHRLQDRVVAAAGPGPSCGSLRSIAALPAVLLFLALYGFALQPAAAGVSRHLERRADLHALRTAAGRPGGLEDGLSSFQKMAARNLSDPDPPAWIEWWLFTHPSPGRRIRLCAEWLARESQAPSAPI